MMRSSAHSEAHFNSRQGVVFMPNNVQRIFNIFVFFLAFPALTFLDVSITFWIFLWLAYKVKIQYGYLFTLNRIFEYLLIVFPGVALVSLLVAPDLPKTTFFGDLKIWFQYLYWVVLTLFLVTHARRVNWGSALKYIFWGINCLITAFYLIDMRVNLGFMSIDLLLPRNAFLFQLLCLVPLALLFTYLQYGKRVFFVFGVFYLFIGFVTQGRAGSILLFFEILFLTILVTKNTWYRYRIALIPLLVLFTAFAFIMASDDNVNRFVAAKVEPFNPRLSNLITGEEEGDLSEDESWLLRQLMILKAIEIFDKYPYFGIGLNHFTRYDSKLGGLRDPIFRDFAKESKEFLNSRSAHNSYFQLLSEVGIVGLLNVLLCFAIIFFRFLKICFSRFNIQILFSLSFAIILIHFFVISSITGAITWFVLGISYYALTDEARVLLPYSCRTK